MSEKRCAFDKERICNEECIAYLEIYSRGSGRVFKKCKRGNFIIKDFDEG